MTLTDIEAQVMFQTNNDFDDLPDFTPHIDDYINEGYDLLCVVVHKAHLAADGIPPLSSESDVPDLPEWLHRALADYATYMVYRNGNPQKQQRGLMYLDAFNKAKGRAMQILPDGSGDSTGEIFKHHLDP